MNSSDSSVESDISDIGDIRQRIDGVERQQIITDWDNFNGISDIARTRGRSVKEVSEALKVRQKLRIEKELRRR